MPCLDGVELYFMDELSKEYVNSVYDTSLAMHGDRPEAVRWSAVGQRARFECLLGIDSSLAGKKILDFGCGKGDFYQFLQDRNIPVRYTGIDINENLISLARSKYPECIFHVIDLEKDHINEEFDYIFLCGVFNLRLEHNDITIQNILSILFKQCRIALAFNALSVHEPKRAPELYYLSPGGIADFAVKNLSPFISLIHDRVPYDFTLFVRRNGKEIVQEKP